MLRSYVQQVLELVAPDFSALDLVLEKDKSNKFLNDRIRFAKGLNCQFVKLVRVAFGETSSPTMHFPFVDYKSLLGILLVS